MTAPYKLLKEHDFYAKKEFGQNFLIDPSSPEMIIRKAEIEQDSNIIEIGPGLGAVTIAASDSAKKIYAIEKDSRLIPILKSEIEKYGKKNIEIINGDILRTEIKDLLSNDNNYLIGNLPYNISSQIIFMGLEHKTRIKKCIFMLQKELAQRITSKHGSREYGRISVVLQYHSEIKTLANLGSNLFYPKPKVDSTVIEINFQKDIKLRAKDETIFHNLVRTAFNQRRKTIKNSLGKAVKDKILLEQMLSKAGIIATARPESLDVDKFVTLSNIFCENNVNPEV